MGKGRFQLNSDQETRLLLLMKISDEQLGNYFLDEVNWIVSLYRDFYKGQRYKPKDVKKRLEDLADFADSLGRSMSGSVFSEGTDTDPTGVVASHLLYANHPRASHNAIRDMNEFVRLSNAIYDLRDAARAALKDPILSKGGRKPNEVGKWFVAELAKLYEQVKNKKPGLGVTTIFYKFTKVCFEYAGHPLSDPMSYIKPVLQENRKGGKN